MFFVAFTSPTTLALSPNAFPTLLFLARVYFRPKNWPFPVQVDSFGEQTGNLRDTIFGARLIVNEMMKNSERIVVG